MKESDFLPLFLIVEEKEFQEKRKEKSELS
jgi:hypothetical protein